MLAFDGFRADAADAADAAEAIGAVASGSMMPNDVPADCRCRLLRRMPPPPPLALLVVVEPDDDGLLPLPPDDRLAAVRLSLPMPALLAMVLLLVAELLMLPPNGSWPLAHPSLPGTAARY